MAFPSEGLRDDSGKVTEVTSTLTHNLQDVIASPDLLLDHLTSSYAIAVQANNP